LMPQTFSSAGLARITVFFCMISYLFVAQHVFLRALLCIWCVMCFIEYSARSYAGGLVN
jgi:hypothetical protein